jgi:hypothetical protein
MHGQMLGVYLDGQRLKVIEYGIKVCGWEGALS